MITGLVRFKHLEEINLSNNDLKSLPQNFCHLDKIKALNISGNSFSDFQGTISMLRTLPKLIKLNIELNDKEMVKFVLSSLPSLKILNDQGN